VLVVGLGVREWLDTKDLEELRFWVARHQPDVVAVDAPRAPSKGLLLHPEAGAKPYGGRKCDRDLRRRGIPLYEVPRERADADPWMETGFQIYEILRDLGYQLPRESGIARSAIEVYPHASFVTLLGGTPAKKSTDLGQTQRLEVLRRHGLRLDTRVDPDSLDALAAALTAIRFLDGQASAVGDPEEALLWLPVDRLEDSYSRLLAYTTFLELAELDYLHRVLSPEERDELLQCLLIAAPRGGEAMIKALEQLVLCHATEELLDQQGVGDTGGAG
jgi:predicted nuclease with RNAse H fold